VRVECGNKERA